MQGHWKAAFAIQLSLLSELRARGRALVCLTRGWLWRPRAVGHEPGLGRAARLSHEYLRMRLPRFREDVTRGAGRTVEELASVVNVRREHVPLFGALLRAHRHELLALARARTLTAPRALRLMRRVGELVLEDPLLRPLPKGAIGHVEPVATAGEPVAPFLTLFNLFLGLFGRFSLFSHVTFQW